MTAWEVSLLSAHEGTYRFKYVLPGIAAGRVEIAGMSADNVMFEAEGPVSAHDHFDAKLPGNAYDCYVIRWCELAEGSRGRQMEAFLELPDVVRVPNRARPYDHPAPR